VSVASQESERTCICVGSIDHCSIGFWNCSDSVVLFFVLLCIISVLLYIGVSEDCTFTITIKGGER